MKQGMVCAAQPEAVEAGAEVLAAGGNAVDAAIATALTQTAVDPQMCGIAGFGSMHVYRPGGRACVPRLLRPGAARRHAGHVARPARRRDRGRLRLHPEGPRERTRLWRHRDADDLEGPGDGARKFRHAQARRPARGRDPLRRDGLPGASARLRLLESGADRRSRAARRVPHSLCADAEDLCQARRPPACGRRHAGQPRHGCDAEKDRHGGRRRLLRRRDRRADHRRHDGQWRLCLPPPILPPARWKRRSRCGAATAA